MRGAVHCGNAGSDGIVIENKKKTDKNFKRKWEDSREEYRLIGEMTALRKSEKVTKKYLAEMTGSKQQVISRIEKY